MENNIKKFTNELLPNELYKNMNTIYDMLEKGDNEEFNLFIKEIWNKYNNTELTDYDFIHAIRKKRIENNTGVLNVLIKLPKEDGDSENLDIVKIVVNKNLNSKINYFVLEKLDDYILPISYIKSNKKYLIIGIDESLNQTNWGAIVNPRNLVDVCDAINKITK